MKAELIDLMGDDLRVVNAARVSFDKESDWTFNNYDTEEAAEASGEIINYEHIMSDRWFGEYPTKSLSEKDQKLLNYLAKHNHWSPFSHVMITMRETVPIFVARQRFKHKVGFTENEVSRRYVDTPPELYIPDEWRGKPVNAKQGSSDEVINLWDYSWHDREDPTGWGDWSIGEELAEYYERVLQTYRRMIEVGVAPEQARMILPQSMYTSYYVTGSLAAWARAYKLRIGPDAQKEIQDLAHQWGDIIGSIPELKYSWEALTK